MTTPYLLDARTRMLSYQGSGSMLFIKDRFGNSLNSGFAVKRGLIELDLLRMGEYYQSDCNEKLYLHRGEGVLEYEDCLRKLDFTFLNVAFLDHYLNFEQYPSFADDFDRKLIQTFCWVFEKNVEKGKHYLLPWAFLQRQSELLE